MLHAPKQAASPTALLSSIEHRAAAWLQQKTRHVSKRAWLCLLVLFVLSVGSYCSYLIIGSFSAIPAAPFTISRIPLPKQPVTGEPKKAKPSFSPKAYNRIQSFQLYMDSLARSPAGRAAYDSILRRHPGLPDSVRRIEMEYQSFKTK